MQIDRSTFCSAPWFQIRNENLGDFKPCCAIRVDKTQFNGKVDHKWPSTEPEQYMNSAYMGYLRQQLTKGHRLPECDRCWQKEQQGRQSLRITTNDSMTDGQWSQGASTWMDSYFRNKPDHAHDMLLSADIKITNLCNFACVMCVPEDSSQLYQLWQKHHDQPHVIKWHAKHSGDVWQEIRTVFQQRDNMELLQWVIDQPFVRSLKILGGEPLMDSKLMHALKNIPQDRKKNISVSIGTNGSHDLVAAAHALAGFKHLHLLISIEGIKLHQEYVRRNSVWSRIETNILDFVGCGIERTSIAAHHVLQAFSWWSLPDLVMWCKQHGVSLTLSHILEPKYLSMSALPQPLLDRIHDQFDFALPDSVDDTSNTADIVPSRTDPAAMAEFYHYLDWLDSTGHMPWATVFPELAELDPRSKHQN